MKKAYTTLQVKSVDEDARRITGIASSVSPDRMEDIVEPKGAQFDLPLPLLWQHDANQPIGHVTAAKTSDDNIEVTAEIAKEEEPGALKFRLDEAWQSLKKGLVRGLSIGFRALESEPIDKNSMGIRFKKWEWLELSAVTIPANAEANIQTVKAICQTPKQKQAYVPRPTVNGGYKLSTVEFNHSRLSPDGSIKLRD